MAHCRSAASGAGGAFLCRLSAGAGRRLFTPREFRLGSDVGNLGHGHSNKSTQRIVDGRRIIEDRRNIGIKEDDVRSLPISLGSTFPRTPSAKWSSSRSRRRRRAYVFDSYDFRSLAVASRAPMIRTVSPQSVCTTTRSRLFVDRPMVMNRASASECTESGIVDVRSRRIRLMLRRPRFWMSRGAT